MNLSEMTSLLDLKTIVPPSNPLREITGGYACDLLSCVMAKAGTGNIWITLQSHPNVVAVASLLDLAGVIVTEGAPMDNATVEKATEAGVALFASPLTTYSVVAKLAQAGIPGTDM